MKILYLENHAVFAEQVIREFLSSHEVKVVPTLAEAFRELSLKEYDLILSDYDLDDGKGDAFVRQAVTTHPQVPIIAVSSHDHGNTALLEAGACAVCNKMQFRSLPAILVKPKPT